MAEQSIIKYSNLIGADGTFDEINKNLDRLEKRLIDLAKKERKGLEIVSPNDSKAIDDYEAKIRELEAAMKNLDSQRKLNNKTKKQAIDLSQEELIAAQADKIRQQDRVKRAKQEAIIRTEEKNTIKSLRAQLTLVSLDWAKLTEEEIKNGKDTNKLTQQKKTLTEQLKRLEKQTGDNRRNVGNYTDSLKGLQKGLMRIFVGRTIIDGVIRLGGALGDLLEDSKDKSTSLRKLSDSFNVLKNATADIGVEFLELIAAPISKLFFDISFAISKVSSILTSARDGIASFSEETTFFGKVWLGVSQIMELPLKPIKALIGFISDFPAILGGVSQVFSEFGSAFTSSFERIALEAESVFIRIQRGVLSLAGQDVSELDLRLNNVTRRLQENAAAGRGFFDAYARGYDAVKVEQEAFNKAQTKRVESQEKEKGNEKAIANRIAEQNTLLKEQERIRERIVVLTSDRLRAIEELEKQVREAEIENIEDRQTQLLLLEEKRFTEEKALNAQQFNERVATIQQQEDALISLYGENSKEVLNFRSISDKELAELEGLNQRLSEEQLITHNNNKLDINTEFAEKEKERLDKQLKLYDGFNKKINKSTLDAVKKVGKLSELAAKKVKEEAELAAKTAKEEQDKFFDDLIESSSKVADKIGESFTKTAEASTKAVERQTELVATQEERAKKGLDNTLKYEQEQLAVKQAEQAKAQQEAKQAAKILALYNLVAAYAQSGDKNALQSALVDFSLLEVFGAATGFIEGTENVEKALGNSARTFAGKDGYMGMTKSGKLLRFDGDERILNPSQNALVSGMSNNELVKNALAGVQITDNIGAFGSEHYQLQAASFKQTSKPNRDANIEAKLDEVKRAIENKPVTNGDIEKITDTAITISKSVTSGHMTRIERIKKRL